MFNNSKLASFPFVLVSICIVGCGGSVDSPWSASGGEKANSVFEGTAHPPNTSVVIPNSLEPDALVPNDLGRHALSIQDMSPATVDELTGPGGHLLRRLLSYAVSCALDPDDQFVLSWTDEFGQAHEKNYNGAVGLAPAWLHRPLNTVEQHWVSACLAARTNWYGEAVKISTAGNLPPSVVTIDDASSFTVREGAFWGNLFGSNAFLRSCYIPENMMYSRSLHRDCAAGHLENGTIFECGMLEMTGPCSDVCGPLSASGYYVHCTLDLLSPNAQTQQVITTYLHDP